MAFNTTAPIGMLDSGVGGLSVLREVRTLLPAESVIYFADEGHLPYGPRQRDEIRQFVESIARFLIAQGCKLIVIACNAANAAALHYLRTVITDIPIVGMEPAIKPAVEHTKTGSIGVITTKVTYQSELFASVLDRFAKDVQVHTQVCPELVTLVEEGVPDNERTTRIIADYLRPLKEANIDQLVLGCTHFPFLTAAIRAYLGPQVAIIDPAPAVARQVKRVLEQQVIETEKAEMGSVLYYTSGDITHVDTLLNTLLSESGANICPVRWQDDDYTLRLGL